MPIKGGAGILAKAHCVLFALLLLLSCGRSSEYYTEKGNTLFAQGQFVEASLNYRKAIQKNPKFGEAYYRLGFSELKQKKGREAYQALTQAVRLMPDHQAAKTELVNLALNSYLADPQRPKALYDALVKLSDEWLLKDPHSLDGLRIKGYVALEDNRPEEAVELFRRAVLTNPKNDKVVLGLMDALFRNNKPADAEKAGLDFIATEKKAGDAYDALYRLYVALNHPADGEAILIRKVKDDPKNANILQLAGHYARAGKKSEMTSALEMLQANSHAGSDVHREVGDFYAAVGDGAKAIEQFNAGMAANPKEKVIYQNRVARVLLTQDKREEALKILQSAAAQDPDDKESHTLRAALLVGHSPASRPVEGIQEFKSLVEKNPDDTYLQFVYSRALVETGDLDTARAQLLEVVKKNPHFLNAQLSLAEIAIRQDRMDEALQRSGLALDLDPNNFQGQLIRGNALLRQGGLEEASAVLGRAARQDPKSVEVRLQLASLDVKKAKFADGEKSFRKILESNPNEWRALQGLVEIDLAQRAPDKAFALLEQELKVSHRAPQVRYMFARTALRIGRYNVAIENLRQLAMETPGSIEPQLELANVFRLKGDLVSAIGTLQKSAVAAPTDPRPASMLAVLLQMSNRTDEAKRQCRLSLSLRPDDPPVMNNLAYLLADTGGNLDEALRLVRQAIKQAPSQPNFADTLGWIYLKRDQNDEAMEIYNSLVRKYPDDPTFSYHMGVTWYQKGEMTRAKAELARALQRGPSKEIEERISDLLTRVN